MTFMPLRYVEAAKPVRSPTTPPPRASKISFLSNFSFMRCSYKSSTTLRVLDSSPAGNTNEVTLLTHSDAISITASR